MGHRGCRDISAGPDIQLEDLGEAKLTYDDGNG